MIDNQELATIPAKYHQRIRENWEQASILDKPDLSLLYPGLHIIWKSLAVLEQRILYRYLEPNIYLNRRDITQITGIPLNKIKPLEISGLIKLGMDPKSINKGFL